METYTLTLWLLWPKAVGQHASEIVRHVVDTLESCQSLATYYALHIAADGVDLWAWSCISQWGV